MPVYEHKCEACNHIWEDIFRLSDPIPNECPECKVTGKVIRLMSWCSGTVELAGMERTQKAWAEGKALARKAKTNEDLKANIIGEERYNRMIK